MEKNIKGKRIRAQGARQETPDCMTTRQKMTYPETLDYLYSRLPAYHRIGKAAYKNDLNTTTELDRYFGHPHRFYRTVHIAGTNGKGSVSHMTASVFQEAGYRTGLYTSPHLKDFRERIRVNGEMISENDVVSFVVQHKRIIELLKPSFFEMSVAMAFDYFAKCEVDIAVIEVGLGGRLDSTNIITPVLSAITNIGHDHMDLLGDTPCKIAAEKAGVIKPGVPVVIGEATDETAGIFSGKARETGSDIYFAAADFTCQLEGQDNINDGRSYLIRSRDGKEEYSGVIPLGGDYQASNLITVVRIFKVLSENFHLSMKDLASGIRNVIKNTGLMGRWQVISRKPLAICDTGHNLEGLKYVIKQFLEIPASERHFVLGFVNDKDIDSVLPLFPVNARYYFTRARVPRAMDEKKLKEGASRHGLTGDSYCSVSEAYAAALSKCSDNDIVFIGGSTFIVAEVI